MNPYQSPDDCERFVCIGGKPVVHLAAMSMLLGLLAIGILFDYRKVRHDANRMGEMLDRIEMIDSNLVPPRPARWSNLQ